MSDPINPSYYKQGSIEVIDAIEDWGLENNFYLATAIKYIARAGKKDPNKYTEDLEKATWYIKRAIKRYKAIQPSTNFLPQEENTIPDRVTLELLQEGQECSEVIKKLFQPNKKRGDIYYKE